MEKNIVKDNFEFSSAVSYSPLVLAYMGDAVYELYIRSMLVSKANTQVNKLHKEATKYVRAKAQSELVEKIMDKLSEEELAIYKRGRNAHSYTSAKNADIVDYRRATGFEALIGYLYIRGEKERIFELLNDIVNEQ